MVFRKHKCYYCKQIVEKEEDNTSDYIGSKTIKHFHKWCVDDYKKLVLEKEKFNEVYECVKDLMGYSKSQQLSPYARNKIMSIRNGSFIKQGDKMYNASGYSYEVILMSLKILSLKIQQSIYGKVFEDDNHKFNYIIAIVMNNINDIQKKVSNKTKIEKLSDRQVVEINNSIEDSVEKYKHGKTKDNKENKVADDLADLF